MSVEYFLSSLKRLTNFLNDDKENSNDVSNEMGACIIMRMFV